MLKRTEKNKKSFLPRTLPGQFYNFNLYLRKNLGVKKGKHFNPQTHKFLYPGTPSKTPLVAPNL